MKETKGEIILKYGLKGSERLEAYKKAVLMLKTSGKRKAIVSTLSRIVLF